MEQEFRPLNLNENLFHVFPLRQFKHAVSVPHRPFSDAQCSFLTFEGDAILSSTLLFQAAVSLCDGGKRVLYLDTRSLSRLPPAVAGMPTPAPSSMSSAQFIYLPTEGAIRHHLAEAHVWPSPVPDAVLLDLTRLPPPAANPVHASHWRVEAALREAVRFLSSSRSTAVLGILAVTSDTGGGDVTVMTPLRRHRVDRTCVVGVSRGEDGRARLQSCIQPATSFDSDSAGVVQLELSLHDSCVKLERLNLLKSSPAKLAQLEVSPHSAMS